jgi:hypothetical protein
MLTVNSASGHARIRALFYVYGGSLFLAPHSSPPGILVRGTSSLSQACESIHARPKSVVKKGCIDSERLIWFFGAVRYLDPKRLRELNRTLLPIQLEMHSTSGVDGFTIFTVEDQWNWVSSKMASAASPDCRKKINEMATEYYSMQALQYVSTFDHIIRGWCELFDVFKWQCAERRCQTHQQPPGGLWFSMAHW